MFTRIKALAKKEIKQLFRDTRLLMVLLLFPVFLLGIFGYAINFDVKHIKLAVYDNDKSNLSRDFVNSLSHSEYFDIVDYIHSDSQIKKYLDEKVVQCIVVIPEDLSEKYYSNQQVKIQYLIDGVNGNTATIIRNYVTVATAFYNQKITNEVLAVSGVKSFIPIDLRPVFWFNPTLQTTMFLLPGLIAMILIITSIISVSLSLVREKERGTIEQVNVSPASSLELLIGKTFPYIIVSLFNAGLILVAGYILFGVEVKGSLLLLFFCSLVFITASTTIGIFISVISDSQQVAFTIGTFFSLLPSMMLSGFVFPIDSMPPLIQIITNITPAKFFIVILRGIMLRGVGIQAFWEQLIYLCLFILVFGGFAVIINRKKEISA
jgi:ABC-2 type transport system permease protein